MGPRDSVVLKLSGEALGGGRSLNGYAFEDVASQILNIVAAGIRVGVVIGGGNFIRGGEGWGSQGLPRAAVDRLGIKGSGYNADALQEVLEVAAPGRTVIVAKPGPVENRYASWSTETVNDPTVDVVLVAGGLSQPGLSTDVAAPVLAVDMGSSRIVMSKHGVKAIYSGDPNNFDRRWRSRRRRPVPIPELTAEDAIARGLRIMDHDAIELCRDYGITVHVVGAQVSNSLERVVLGRERLGSVMRPSAAAPGGTPEPARLPWRAAGGPATSSGVRLGDQRYPVESAGGRH